MQNIVSKKNLLAFSGGVDSTALFFLLYQNNIPFDIAIVNYNVREEAKDEVIYAKELAKKYNKKIFIKSVKLDNSNFEAKAREIRYKFFEDIIIQNQYESLITAHQLNDKLEWFFMQLSKGAGVFELIGLEEVEYRENYILYRPLLKHSKDELIDFLEKNNIKYFIDKTNFDTKYKRNFFRLEFSNKFLNLYKDGVKRSFEYLEEDIKSLKKNYKLIEKKKSYVKYIYKNQDINIAIRIIDKELKKRKIIISSKQRQEILRQKEIIISNIAIYLDEKYILIAPFVKVKLDKKFKEKCRINKIPKYLRGYFKLHNLI